MASYKILHAEDDDDWADLVERRLSAPKFRVERAESGARAIALAGKLVPDLAVLDIQLSDMSGRDLCERLRELPGLERLPVVVLSAHTIEKVKSLRIGADAF